MYNGQKILTPKYAGVGENTLDKRKNVFIFVCHERISQQMYL